MENVKDVKGNPDQVINIKFYLSKYPYKKALVNKHPKSILVHGKVTEQLIKDAISKDGALTVYNQILNQNLGNFVIIYVQREPKNIVHR